MRIIEDRAASGTELLPVGYALIDARALILFFSRVILEMRPTSQNARSQCRLWVSAFVPSNLGTQDRLQDVTMAMHRSSAQWHISQLRSN